MVDFGNAPGQLFGWAHERPLLWFGGSYAAGAIAAGLRPMAAAYALLACAVSAAAAGAVVGCKKANRLRHEHNQETELTPAPHAGGWLEAASAPHAGFVSKSASTPYTGSGLETASAPHAGHWPATEPEPRAGHEPKTAPATATRRRQGRKARGASAVNACHKQAARGALALGHVRPCAFATACALFVALGLIHCSATWLAREQRHASLDGAMVEVRARVASGVAIKDGMLSVEIEPLSLIAANGQSSKHSSGQSSEYASELAAEYASGQSSEYAASIYSDGTMDEGKEAGRLLLNIDAGAQNPVYWGDSAERSLRDALRHGNEIVARGKLRKPTEQGNEGLFDYALYLYSRGLCASLEIATPDGITDCEGDPRLSVAGFGLMARERAERALYAALPEQDAALLAGIALGKSDGVSSEDKEGFAAAGVLHLLAVSGAHVAIVAGCASFLLKKAGAGARAAQIGSLAVVLAFAVIAGFSASVVRAAVAFGASSAARLFRKGYDGLSALGLAALALLAINPMQVFSAGFELSFACALSIATLSPAVTWLLSKIRMPRKATAAAATAVAVQVGVAPLQAALFGTLPLLAIPANIAASPLIAATLCLALATALAGAAFAPLAIVPAALAKACVSALRALATGADSAQWLTLRVSAFGAMGTMAYYSAAAVFAARAPHGGSAHVGTARGGAAHAGAAAVGAARYEAVPVGAVHVEEVHERATLCGAAHGGAAHAGAARCEAAHAGAAHAGAAAVGAARCEAAHVEEVHGRTTHGSNTSKAERHSAGQPHAAKRKPAACALTIGFGAIAAAGLAFAVAATWAVGAYGARDRMEIVFLDVGNANAAYLNIGGEHSLVVDAGGVSWHGGSQRSNRRASEEARLAAARIAGDRSGASGGANGREGTGSGASGGANDREGTGSAGASASASREAANGDESTGNTRGNANGGEGGLVAAAAKSTGPALETNAATAEADEKAKWQELGGGERRLAQFLLARGVTRIDAAIATHGDSDHVDGFYAVFDAIRVGTLLIPPPAGRDDADGLRNLAKRAQAAGTAVVECVAGDSFALGASATLEILSPPSGAETPGAWIASPNANDLSLLTAVSFGDSRALFCGDIGASGEAALVASAACARLASDIVSMPHHGSKGSGTLPFAIAVSPRLAVIGTGRNTYGHPSPEAIARFESAGALIRRTDMDGMVTAICRMDGNISAKSFRSPANRRMYRLFA